MIDLISSKKRTILSEEILSTEMSDLADNEIYLRYKISKQELKESKEEFEKR